MKDNNCFLNMQCIWMASNIVDYKLCDREFNCDSCSFDKSIRNIQHHVSSPKIEDTKSKAQYVIQNVINKIESTEFNSHYHYFSNHLVAKNLFVDTYYLGFSPVMISLMDNYTRIDYCSRGDVVRKDQPILKIVGPWGETDVTAPMDFTCLGHITENRNSAERWFSLIESSRDELQTKSAPVSDYHRDIISVAKELTNFQINYPEIGLTMMDGGIDARYLFQIIGNSKYSDILNTLFHKSLRNGLK
ncbi:MAG: hypothetical protein WCJ01_04755 [Ignavibacteria bacterium]